jgi:hypothetical protein
MGGGAGLAARRCRLKVLPKTKKGKKKNVSDCKRNK